MAKLVALTTAWSAMESALWRNIASPARRVLSQLSRPHRRKLTPGKAGAAVGAAECMLWRAV